jgi:pyrroline-5-carboxylate reductase
MKIAIVGCGNMGLIYARSFLKYDIVNRENLFLAVRSESRREELIKMNTGQVVLTGDPAIGDCDLVIISVKPQDFYALATDLKPALKPGNTLLSIMAGMKMEKIAAALGQENILRAMPNSPAEQGMGMTAFTAGKNVAMKQVRLAENLLATTGRTVFFESEDLLDAVTALSGSGPAYFFYIVKNMIEAGRKMGFDEATAALLVKQTMLGSFHLINNANKSLDDLIKAVASKGGTTEAAFNLFGEKEVGENLQQGIIRARDRAKELSK